MYVWNMYSVTDRNLNIDMFQVFSSLRLDECVFVHSSPISVVDDVFRSLCGLFYISCLSDQTQSSLNINVLIRSLKFPHKYKSGGGFMFGGWFAREHSSPQYHMFMFYGVYITDARREYLNVVSQHWKPKAQYFWWKKICMGVDLCAVTLESTMSFMVLSFQWPGSGAGGGRGSRRAPEGDDCQHRCLHGAQPARAPGVPSQWSQWSQWSQSPEFPLPPFPPIPSRIPQRSLLISSPPLPSF